MGGHWFILAFESSTFFAAVHLHYAPVYGVTSILPFTDIVTFGMAMAITYYFFGGNVIIPALLHGAYDATVFLTIATQSELGLILRLLMIGVCLFAALIVLVQKRRVKCGTREPGLN